MSLLTRQHRLMGAPFFNQHAADWLVWEPGPSAPARTTQQSNTQQTLNPRVAQPASPLDEDALCFELKRTPGQELLVGRATENHIVVNDLTVSREHFRLRFDGDGWALRALGGALQLDGAPVGPEEVRLHAPVALLAGDVRLSFYDVNALLERLTREAARR